MNDNILATLAKGEQNATVNFSDNLQLTSSAILISNRSRLQLL